MGRNETRLDHLEDYVSPRRECIMLMFTDWEPGEEPPPEEIEVSVSYCDNRKPEKMSLAEYRKRFPEWEQHETITIGWEDEV